MRLTTRQVQAVVAAAVAKASEIRVPMNIAVLDAGGHLKSFLRMDGAVLGSIDIALKKARTAVLFETNSEAVWEYCKPGAPAPGLQLTNDILATFAGGIPFKTSDGQSLGAIGVSGGAVSQDAEVAKAGAAAFGLAKKGHKVIATVQISPQIAPLRREAADLQLKDFRVEKLDLQDPYDVAQALTWDIDVLWNNAGVGESGPVSEIPIDLVRRNFETNVFLPLALTQGFIKSWVASKKKAKIVFTSSMGGLFTPAGFGTYVSTKHALESVAEAMQQELQPFGIKVQTINPGAYLTGYNETMADTAFRWLDDSRNFTKRAALRATFDSMLGTPEGRLDPEEMIGRMIDVVPADTGKFRNVCPQFVEDMLKKSQLEAWDRPI